MANDHIAVSGLPTFEQLLRDPMEQFDKRSELLTSVLQYLSAAPASAGTQRWDAAETANRAWLFTPSAGTTGTAA